VRPSWSRPAVPSVLIALAGAIAGSAAAAPGTTQSADTDSSLSEVVITAERLNLIGTATTSSQGVVVNDEL